MRRLCWIPNWCRPRRKCAARYWNASTPSGSGKCTCRKIPWSSRDPNRLCQPAVIKHNRKEAMPEQTLVKWNEETILEHLKKIAKEQLNLTPEQIEKIGPNVSLVEALQLDSLAQVVLVTTIEQDFGCAFGLDQWQQLETVQDLVKMIAGRVCEQEPQA